MVTYMGPTDVANFVFHNAPMYIKGKTDYPYVQEFSCNHWQEKEEELPFRMLEKYARRHPQEVFGKIEKWAQVNHNLTQEKNLEINLCLK